LEAEKEEQKPPEASCPFIEQLDCSNKAGDICRGPMIEIVQSPTLQVETLESFAQLTGSEQTHAMVSPTFL